jgi:hypothetical protein
MSHSQYGVIASHRLETEANLVGAGETPQDKAPCQPKNGINCRLLRTSKTRQLVRRDIKLNTRVYKPEFARQYGQAREEARGDACQLLSPKDKAAFLAGGLEEIKIMRVRELVGLGDGSFCGIRSTQVVEKNVDAQGLPPVSWIKAWKTG